MKRFTLQDLKSGHRVENRMGVRYIVLKDSYNGVMLFSDNCYSSAKYDNDLLCINSSCSKSDIMKVFLVDNVAETLNHKAKVTLVWERPTYTELFDVLEKVKIKEVNWMDSEQYLREEAEGLYK